MIIISFVGWLIQKVQKALLQSDVQSKSDKSPVTVAYYGSQAVVSLLLQRELSSEPFSFVAEEDSADLRKDGSQDILERITKLVDDTLATEDILKPIDSTLSTDDILRAIDCGIKMCSFLPIRGGQQVRVSSRHRVSDHRFPHHHALMRMNLRKSVFSKRWWRCFLRSVNAAYGKIKAMLSTLGDPFTRIITPKQLQSLTLPSPNPRSNLFASEEPLSPLLLASSAFGIPDCVIHGFTPANRASHYQNDLKAGSIVRLDRFEVARVAHMYKIAEHQFLIRFIPSTRIVEVQTDAHVIKFDKFMVRRYDHLQVLANTNLELPDVVGEIHSVQGSDLKNSAATSRVVVRFLVEPYLKLYSNCFHDRNVTVYLSLWDEAASTFRGFLKAEDKSHSVMLVTTVNPKLFGGNMYLNSTQGTKFFFDTNIPEITYVGATTAHAYTCVDTLQGIKKKELVSIRDLNSFISNSTEQIQEADFLCKAQIVSVIQENGRCETPDVTGVVRFRVELAVDDGKDSATFVVFDKEMTKLTKHEAAVLALDEDSNGGEDYLPSCLKELTGKEFVFQIRVTPFNFTPNHRTFTVSTITEESTTANHSKEHIGNILPNRGGDLGLAASSSGPSVLGDKIGENADAEKNRKRGRE
ncbi:hypothetical protein IGI04_023364 [Brassica rapa subsp. trilocularis]|uniref:Replication factor A C-terminal domain-containing protein n=1 Tax=Brassica rapa subsp. trilocularis TaxID=1813537 RepID=A0ABQ7M607_BRACM|nr:hypothetical protein IGI04_023364 [Brassica rapa subsp. trilocularis]